jgi:hypothetical protein
MEITLEDTLDPSLHDTFTKLIALIQSVEQLPDGSLKNSAEDRKYSLVVKLSDIGRLIFEGDYDSAINKLTQDILKKMDGCPPEADKNDWIIECTDQTGMQEQVEGLIDAIEDLK